MQTVKGYYVIGGWGGGLQMSQNKELLEKKGSRSTYLCFKVGFCVNTDKPPFHLHLKVTCVYGLKQIKHFSELTRKLSLRKRKLEPFLDHNT